MTSPTAPSTTRQRTAAWAVHAYTASGSVFALLFVLAALDGDLKEAFVWSAAAVVVDATDGTLARAADVKRHTPSFDGALLDNILDYITYVFAPMVLLQVNGFLPDGTPGLVVASLPVLASCYQFCRTDAKTDDHTFLGFPSYWNVVAFYVVVLELSVAVTTTVLLVCTVLVFVPINYLYPSRATSARPLHNALATVWGLSTLVLLVQLPDPSRTLALVSLLYVPYYVGVSLLLTVRRRRPRA